MTSLALSLEKLFENFLQNETVKIASLELKLFSNISKNEKIYFIRMLINCHFLKEIN